MTLRNLARFGMTGALAVGALGLAATPALAAEVDFGVSMTGTTIAADANAKFAKLTVANQGTGAKPPAQVVVHFDFSKLDRAKVDFSDLDGDDACKINEPAAMVCTFKDQSIPGPGATKDFNLPLWKVTKNVTGAAGSITVRVAVAGDTNKANDSKTVRVNVGDNGADLIVYAPDVTAANDKGDPTGKPIAPGAVGALDLLVFNDGDRTAEGLRLTVTLPQQTSFATAVEGCSQTADKRILTCVLPKTVLIPVDKAGSGGTAVYGRMVHVQVSPDAKGPVALKGGSATATAINQVPYSPSQARTKEQAAATLPEGFVPLTAARLAELDADRSDNTDGFAVIVAASAGGPGTGGPGTGGPGTGGPGTGGPGTGGPGTGGPGTGGGGLPVTGPAGYALVGGGLAAVAIGVTMFIAARRRRVVLVTPGDDK